MKISFIVTCYNHEKFILQALQSIESQSIRVDELIIADDCSSDGTVNIVKTFISSSKIPVIKFIENKLNMGISKNAHKAINAGTGDILIFQAGDDLSAENRASKTIECFENVPRLCAIYSSYSIIDENSTQIKTKLRKGEYSNPSYFIRKGAMIPPYGVAVRRLNVKAMPHPPEYLKNEDDFLGMYFILNGGIKICEEILYKYRVHKDSYSSWYNSDLNFIIYLKKFLSNQEVRIDNLRGWKQLFSNQYINSMTNDDHINFLKLSAQIERKIQIKNQIMNLRSVGFSKRICTALRNFDVLNAQEFLILILGISGIFFIRSMRKL
jgi:glycosyltransferase involved in cell wall biosynthesis